MQRPLQREPLTGNLPRFTRSLWLTPVAFIAFAASFVLYVGAEKQIDHANDLRHSSFLLADELRQSSDDLTRMVRTYVVSGDSRYKQHYQEILDIRNGIRPRPVDYQNVYWDLVLSDGQRPRPLEPVAHALLERMRQAGFTVQELAKLAEAKANSDALTRTEFAAMALVETSAATKTPQHAKAIAMLHDSAYHQAKAGIMQPIAEFYRMADQRTLDAVHTAAANATRMRLAFILFGLVLVSLLWQLRRNLRAVLGGTVDELHSRISLLGRGDFATPIPVAAGMENSVLGWLAETQTNLSRSDRERQSAEAKSQRLTSLYAALSQCNQAIVRCADETELFNQICRVVVSIGGIKMAWIGVPGADGCIHPIASFGSGREYLDDLRIATSATDPYGHGPTGAAYRENRPHWCQDFMHDPATAPWHERGVTYGWAASAGLPLHRNGAVFGVFSLYADTINAFDDEVRNLLLEMASDIDFALKGFDREALRQNITAALQASEQRLRTIIETEPECIKVLSAEGDLLEMNAAGLAMLEADSLEQARQKSLLDFVSADYRDAFRALHQQVMNGSTEILAFEIVGLRGTRRWLETHAAPMRDATGKVTMLLGITRDITERKQAETRIQYLAHFDALTGLPNRTQLDDRARFAISLAQRSQAPLALLLLDLDHFKDINDTLGHSIGDALLIEAAHRLRLTLRDEDTACRLGGDEFIFLLPGTSARGAAHVAQKLLAAIAEPYHIEEYDLSISGSIGIALYPEDGKDLETLSKSADAAMYNAKQEGRRGYRFFTAAMQAKSARHLQLVNALRHALEDDQLRIHYQPQVSMRDGRIVGAEALLRWTHPELGAVSPAEFIPAAEDSGLILPIGEWVLRHAARQATQWMRDGMPPLVMAVNLSAVQFRHPDLPNLVSRILDEEGLPPEYLELELTEGVAMYDPQSAIAVMNDLHERGVRMSIDDFGTGYSSLSHLKKFKVYKLKIDQSFVRDISTDPEDKAIVGAVIQMAHSLGLMTIAEGVETQSQLAFLREQGCGEMQGYFFSKPLPAADFAAFSRLPR